MCRHLEGEGALTCVISKPPPFRNPHMWAQVVAPVMHPVSHRCAECYRVRFPLFLRLNDGVGLPPVKKRSSSFNWGSSVAKAAETPQEHVAQLVSATGDEPGGRRFESCHARLSFVRQSAILMYRPLWGKSGSAQRSAEGALTAACRTTPPTGRSILLLRPVG